MAQFSLKNSAMSGISPASFLFVTLFKYSALSPMKEFREGTTTYSLPKYETASMIPLGSILNLI